MGIEQVDKNFVVETNIQKDGIKFYDVKDEPFRLYGVFYENGKLRRMPESVAKRVSDGVYALHSQTAGGRVRFTTDSPYVAIHMKAGAVGKMPHFALSGSSGFDLYATEQNSTSYAYKGTFMPPFNYSKGYESVIDLGDARMRILTIDMPLYTEVCELYIGLKDTAQLELSPSYGNQAKPMVYYGSSITQGGCASRAGTSYEAIISRRFDCDYLNLGFSGSARAEEEIADYIKGLEMSLFVFDYDHNAPDVKYLQNTHERMFKQIRSAQPNLPVIMLSRPKAVLNEEEQQRLKIVEATYNNAKAAGDENVYFISGPELMKYAGDDGTVDNCHPTDWGFASMARVLGDFIEENREKLGI